MNAQAAFVRSFLRIQGDLFAYILSRGIEPLAAEDVLQDAAVVLLEKYASFQPGTDFKAWAFAVVRFEVLKSHRSAGRRALLLDAGTLDRLEGLAASEAEAAPASVGMLQRCLERLTGSARELIRSRYRDGLSVEEIAQRLARPVNSVHVTLSRIRKALSECMERAFLAERARP